MKFKTKISDIGDPFVVKHEDLYYVYATSYKSGFYVWVSKDLKTFSEPKVCYEKNNKSFGYRDFWAPEVIYDGKKFIMHYTARSKKSDSLRIGVAVSSSPLGPFEDIYDGEPMFDFGYAAIDGHVFIDSDEKKYFYFSKDCSENWVNGVKTSEIYVAKLSDDCLRLESEPKKLITPTKAYETIAYFDGDTYLWNEGAYVIKEADTYYLMYSANHYADKYYCICAAKSKYPDKDFVKFDQPILTYKDINESGPGHHMMLKNGKGYICVFHVHTHKEKPSGNRTMCYIPVTIENDQFLFDK
ncbi:glycoside hydrolase family 43 protein [Acholeplasma granularum]|uniref:glycoside hydrolase family 43 protein n=1 Tax=Acholeplasma granularum TaxID=264635 RepID=UPI000472E245|nr:glycoside hydrolase family 43 protein [Acholeplasma granularum]